MGLVDVHVVRLQAPEGAVDGLYDVFAGQAAVVLAFSGGEESLGHDLDSFAAHACQGFPEHRFCFGACVGLRCVKGGDAQVQSLAHTRRGDVLVYGFSVRGPVA